MLVTIPTFSSVILVNELEIIEVRPMEYTCFNGKTIKGSVVFLRHGRYIESSFTMGELQKYINQQLGENK